MPDLDPDPTTPVGALSAAIFALNTLQFPDASAPVDVMRLAAMTDDAIATLVEMRQQYTSPVTWPETEAEVTAFTDWQTEVSDGDTMLGYQAWVAAHKDDEPKGAGADLSGRTAEEWKTHAE